MPCFLRHGAKSGVVCLNLINFFNLINFLILLSLYFCLLSCTKMKIRTANRSDAETIISFQQNMAMETEGMHLNGSIISVGVYAVFDDPSKGKYYVAEDNGKIVASLMITYEWSDWRNSNIWWFQSVYVLPEARRGGIFRQMYDYIKEEALKQGIPGLRLYVEKDNIRAQQTYEAMGMNGDHYRFYEWFS